MLKALWTANDRVNPATLFLEPLSGLETTSLPSTLFLTPLVLERNQIRREHLVSWSKHTTWNAVPLISVPPSMGWFWPQFQLPAHVQNARQQKMAQTVGFLPSTWKIQIYASFWLQPSLAPASWGHYRGSQKLNNFCLSVSPCLSRLHTCSLPLCLYCQIKIHACKYTYIHSKGVR